MLGCKGHRDYVGKLVKMANCIHSKMGLIIVKELELKDAYF